MTNDPRPSAIVTGASSGIGYVVANVTPADVLAERHTRIAKPES
jgi:short-subunit dehydrogenase